MKKWKLWRVTLWVSPLVTLLVGYQTFQSLKEASIILSPVGDPVFLGGYALLNIFVSGILLFREKNTVLQDLLVFLMFFNTILVFLSGSRGAIFSFIVSAAVLCIFLYSSAISQKVRKKIQYILPIFLLAVFLLFLFANAHFSRGWLSSPTLSPFRSVVHSFRLDGLKERAAVWLIGAEGFIEKPLTGWGWENFDKIYDRYFKPRLLGVSVRDFFLDRSYNQLVDILSLAGIFGFLAYSFFWYTIFLSIYKALQKEREEFYRIFLIVLATFFVSYFFLSLTTFDTPANLVIFFLMLAFTYYATHGVFITATNLSNKKLFLHEAFAEVKKRLSPLILGIYICAVILLSSAIYFFNIRDVYLHTV